MAQGGATGQRPGGLGIQGPGRGQARALPLRDDAPRGTAVIRGRIVAADNGSAIRRAQVRIVSNELRESRVAATDAQGNFTLPNKGTSTSWITIRTDVSDATIGCSFTVAWG